jgi:hypothetical protein
MKLPKCPHCQKILVGMLPYLIHAGSEKLIEEATYFCPETGKKQKPEWVEVLEV